MNEPREYKNSIFYTLLVIIIVGGSIFALLAVIGIEQTGFIMLPMAVVFGIFSISFLYMAASRTTISEDEISSKTMFSTKTLKWNEIARVSGSGYAIKLHNVHEDVIVAVSPRLPGYQEIVEQIGIKRPDLFNPQQYSKMRGSLLRVLAQSLVGLSIIGVAVFVFTIRKSEDSLFPLVLTIAAGLFIIGAALLAPQSVLIQGKSIIIGYLFTRKTLTAAEVSSIYFGYAQTRRGGKNYYMLISIRQGSAIRISRLKPSLPIAYLVLKNWHKQNT